MHAWVEVLLPVGTYKSPTWVAYDPTHQRRCDERYIAVAVGRDYHDIAPTSGYYMGASANSLFVTVSVIMETHGPGERWVNPQMMLQETGSSSDQEQQQ
jgi:transglutaminase-like putative cysteine protease